MSTVNLLQNNVLDVILKQNSPKDNKANAPKFSETLKDMISQVDDLQKNSAKSIENFVAGKEGNLHEVVSAMEEAQLSFQLMIEIRNKLLESYQELMRMQV